jgi:hypothetical protein
MRTWQTRHSRAEASPCWQSTGDDPCRRGSHSTTRRDLRSVLSTGSQSSRCPCCEADVDDNADEQRLSLLEPEEAARLRSKYQRARSILSQAPEPHPEKTQREYEAECATIGIPREIGKSWNTFWCGECGLPAATLTLVFSEVPDSVGGPVGYRLVLTTFLGAMAPSIADGDYAGVMALFEHGDAQPFYDRNPELVPFWCPPCQLSYCGDHWKQQTKFDDGFFDEIIDTCPHGHHRQLWD